MRILKLHGDKLLIKELRKSYNFFIKEANLDTNSDGYGLIRDKDMYANEIASIASVGYGLAALIIGTERKWIKYEKAYNRAEKTLDTFLNNVEGKNGFYYHFVNMNTGKREWNCEISIIDTAIFICGAIVAGEFFGKTVKEKAEELYKRMENPIIRLKRNKQETINFLETQVSNILSDDDALIGSFTLSLLENNLEPIQVLYEEDLKREVYLLKEKYKGVKIKKKK